MSRGDRGWSRRRPGIGRRRFSVWPLAVIVVLAGLAMGLVWEHVQFTRASLRNSAERERQKSLLSDYNSYRLKVQQLATLSELDPEARQRLGLTDLSTDDMRLVAFGPESPAPASSPGLIDQIVPEARAGGRQLP